MSLKRLFWLVSVALMSLFLLLTAGQIVTQWKVYRHGTDSVHIVRQLQLALRVMELISVERGPTNGVLGADQAEAPAAQEKLAQARMNSDRSIAALLDDLHRHPDPAASSYPGISASMQTLRADLAAARQNVDRLARLPLAARDSEQISAAVNRMIALIGHTLLATTDLAAIAIADDPELRNGLASARLAASLREYAGQIGSQFTAAIVTKRPLQSNEVIAIAKLTGRAEQMRFILDLQLRSYKSPPALRSALDDVDTIYFGEGMPLLNRLLQIGLHSGEYGMSTGELAARYVPKMQGIVVLRDEVMDETLDDARARTRRAGIALLGVIALALAALALFYVLLRVMHTRVVAPVLESTQLFVALANGDLNTPIPAPRGVTEINNLYRAMQVFKDSGISRIALEKEREALITQLQATSDTDFLTGLMNRRAFFTQGESVFALTQRYQNQLALILMDIDHFKRVNDEYGHQTGDMALQQVATLCRQMHRKGDIVVRYGGEEFLMLLPHTDMAQAIGVAEKLRMAIAAQTVALVSGEKLQLSASFGVAAYDGDSSLEALIWRADQALYNAKNNGRNQVCAGNTGFGD